MSAATTPIHKKEMSVVSPTSRFAHTEIDLKLFRPFIYVLLKVDSQRTHLR